MYNVYLYDYMCININMYKYRFVGLAPPRLCKRGINRIMSQPNHESQIWQTAGCGPAEIIQSTFGRIRNSYRFHQFTYHLHETKLSTG